MLQNEVAGGTYGYFAPLPNELILTSLLRPFSSRVGLLSLLLWLLVVGCWLLVVGCWLLFLLNHCGLMVLALRERHGVPTTSECPQSNVAAAGGGQ